MAESRLYARKRIDGEIYEIDEAPALDKKLKHDVEVVVDRLVVGPDMATRLAESFEAALKLAEGLAYVDLVEGTVADLSSPLPPAGGAGGGAVNEARQQFSADTPSPSPSREREGSLGGAMKGAGIPANRIVFSEKFACPVSGFTIAEIEPRLFSFNAPQGACPACDGLGEKLLFDEDLVVPNHALSIKKGAVVPWAKSNPPSPYYMQVLGSLAREFGFSLDTAWEDLPGEVKLVILHGTGGKPVTLTFVDGRKSYDVKKPFEGVIGNLNRRAAQTESAWMREELSKYQSSAPCEVCHGARLKPEALAVKIGMRDISSVTRLSVVDALTWFQTVPADLSTQQNAIAERILKEILERLGFLNNVGLDYLNLDRTSGTLSGGESQRIRLASQIGSGLSGVLYVLDEPSIGLHQRDNDMLLKTLRRLRDLGNTVLVVEHDEDAIRTADYVIDMGPGAGVHGGQRRRARHVRGSAGERKQHHRRLSLGPARWSPLPEKRRKGNGKKITVHNATANNLKGVTASLPLGTFTCITGVSGSGKSSFTIDTLYAAAARSLNGARIVAGKHDKVTGLQYLDKVIDIDQSPIGRTPRSNPATYTGAFTQIRDWFAGLPESKPRAAINRGASASTSRAAGARRARATACSRSKCTSSPTSTSPATCATAHATIARRSR